MIDEKRKAENYLRHKNAMRERNRESSAYGRDIAPVPNCVNPERKERCRNSFKDFCETYFPNVFTIPWSNDHLKVISKIEKAVKDGGKFAIAMPRGSGKALSCKTKIPTRDGFKTMGEIKVGDIVIGGNGFPCRVTFATEIQKNRKCYRLYFDNDESVIADEDHNWKLIDGSVKTTKELIKNKKEFVIPRVKETFMNKSLPFISCLGRFYKPTIINREFLEYILKNVLRGSRWRMRSEDTIKYLKIKRINNNRFEVQANIELIGELHQYYRYQKVLFLNGVHKNFNNDGNLFFNDPYLKRALNSLGVRYVHGKTNKEDLMKCCVPLPDKVRLLSFKEVKSEPVRCIQVSSKDSTYLFGEHYTVTHNTSLCETACVWAAIYGYHKYILVIGCEAGAASNMFESIKTELSSNELLYEDFPEVCYPIVKLDGVSNRAKGQHINGQRTFIEWNKEIATLPFVEGSVASNCFIRYAGITGNIRGAKLKRESDGESVRPTLCIIDDPQTDESARSPKQIQDRLKVIVKTILNLPGAGHSISAICPCTVIEKGDVADRLLNKKEFPEWQGEKLKALYSFPENMELWTEYYDILSKSYEDDEDETKANKFYEKNRKEMDKGAVVAWEDRKTSKEISALQFLMNKYFEDKSAFLSEFQQDPVVENMTGDQITVGHVFDAMNGLDRNIVPMGAERITAFADVQKNVLFYAVCAFSSDFTGYLIDYGTFPKQNRRLFDLESLSPSLEEAFSVVDSFEARLNLALTCLTQDLLNKKFKRQDGVEMMIQKMYIDANWGDSTDTIYSFCQRSGTQILTPSHGKFFGPQTKPIRYKKKEQGETIGHEWYYPAVTKNRAIRHIIINTNWWKSFFRNRLFTRIGGSGSFSIFGSDTREHELLANHLTAEFFTPTIGNDRLVDVWQLKPNMHRNDWFDCIVGCCVAASEIGCARPEFFEQNKIVKRAFDFGKASRSEKVNCINSNNKNIMDFGVMSKK